MAPTLEVLAQLDELPDSLTIQDVMRLWHGVQWTRAANTEAQADWVRLQRAIKSGDLVCDVQPAREEIRHLPAGVTRFSGFKDWDNEYAQVEHESAPKPVKIPAVYRVRRAAMRAWLALPSSPLLPSDCLLLKWLPVGVRQRSGRPQKIGATDLVPEARDLIAAGVSQGDAARRLAEKYSAFKIKAESVERAVRRDGEVPTSAPRKSAAVRRGRAGQQLN